MPAFTGDTLQQKNESNQYTLYNSKSNELSSAGGSGTPVTSTMFTSQTFTNQQFSILNGYTNPEHHNLTLDLTSYQIPDWDLYRATLDINSLTANVEKEVIATTPPSGTQDFYIHRIASLIYLDQLTQSFYNQPYNGSLLNYSIYYEDFGYDESTFGYALITVRSSYDVSSSNVTNQVNFTHQGTPNWRVIDGQNADLDSNTNYSAVIDGSNMYEVSNNYPSITWHTLDSAGTFDTGLHLSAWSTGLLYEALLRYEYIPWNRTSNSALTFQNPSDILFRANDTLLTNPNTWEFNSPSGNLNSIRFDSNQSVDTNYNLTLWYKKTASTSTSWNIPSSSSDVIWNATVTTAYPTLTGTTARYLNMTKMSDWTPTGLYNGSSSTDYGNRVVTSVVVTCSLMTNGSWTLQSTADNYVSEIIAEDSSDNTVLTTNVSVEVDVNLISLIKDTGGINATSGSTNLTIWDGGAVAWAASPNEAVTNGFTEYLWDVSVRTPDNTKYRIEVFWTNGTEAGYLTREMVVWYPTTLTPQQVSISDFTNDNFEIRVDFLETFYSAGLDLANATVNCSLSGGYAYDFNILMDDGNNNGTWTKTISTAGWDPGTYEIDIIGQGFALQNQTTSITVNLVHDTDSLIVQWTSGSTISYVESTTIKVTYRNATGALNPIPGATLNATINSVPYVLVWNPGSETYDYTFNGNDDPPGLGTHSITILAWRDGYEPQSDSSEVLVIQEDVPTLTPNWVSQTIDWTQQITLTIQYRDSLGALISNPDSKVVTINGTDYTLSGNAGVYTVAINKTWDLGYHEVNVSLSKFGYTDVFLDTISFTIIQADTNLDLVWSGTTIDYLGQIDLTANYSYTGDGSTVPVSIPSNANITINGITTLQLNTSGNLWIANFTGVYLDLGTHSVVIRFWEYGYIYREEAAILTVNNVTTFLGVTWTPANVTIDYTQSLDLVVEYTYGAGDVPSAGNSVNVTINGFHTELSYITGAWRGTIQGTDLGPGVYTAQIDAWLYGYEWRTNVTSDVNITLAPNTFLVVWEPNRNISYIELINVSVYYTHLSSPVLGANISLYINSLIQTQYTWIYDAGSETYNLTIPGYNIGLGTWNITITGERVGYNSGTDMFFVTVLEDVVTVLPEASIYDYNTDYVTSVTFNINVTMSNTTLLDACVVMANISGMPTAFGTNVAAGTYEITLGPLIDPGLHVATITVTKYGYEITTIYVNVNVTETNTEIDGAPANSFRYYDQNLIFDISYNMWNGTVIDPSNYTLLIDGNPETMSWASDHWHAIIQGEDFGIGVHNCYLEFSAKGYESQNHTFTLTVNAIPVAIVFPSQNQVYVNSSLIIEFNYLDTRTMSAVTGDTVTITWENENYNISLISAGLYNLTIYTEAIHVGDYQVEVFISTLGYSDITENMSIVVNPIITDLIFRQNAELQYYENATYSFTVQLNDTIHNVYIGNSNITLVFQGIVYPMIFNSDSMDYTVEIYFENGTIGTYDILVIANTTDAMDADDIYSFVVNAKIKYNLELTLSQQVFSGGELVASANITQLDNSPARDKTITFHATFIIQEGQENSTLERTRSAISNNDGIAVANFDVPSNAIEVTVWAEYVPDLENKADWTATAGQQVRAINPPADLLSLILQIFMRSDIQVLLVVAFVMGAVGVAYSKRIKPKKQARFGELKSQLKEFESLSALQHFMAVYLEQGTCVFYYPFSNTRIEPDLISGFIAAITSVYGEIKGNGVKGTLEEIHYHGLRLNSYSGKYIIGILILEGDMTKRMREQLQVFVNLFESNYAEDLEGWVGHYSCFDPEWVIQNLNETMNYTWHLPHTVSSKKRLNKEQKKIVDAIKGHMDSNGEFLIEDALEPVAKALGVHKAIALHFILKLREPGVINPIGIHTVLARQGFGMVPDDSNNMEMYSPPDIGTEESIEEEEIEEPEIVESEESVEEEVTEPVEEVIPEEEVTEETKSALEAVDALFEGEVREEEPKAETEEKPAKKGKKAGKKPEKTEDAAAEVEEVEEKDELDEFVKDVEALLSKEKKDDESED